MSQGTATHFRRGKKDKSRIYVQIKNGSVYRYPRRLTEAGIRELHEAIKANKQRVKLNNWEKVRAA